MENTKVVCVSRDLPFAQKRFCGAEGIEHVVNASDFAAGTFGKTYGIEMANGPLHGENGHVDHPKTEYIDQLFSFA
jgi:thiol peroxidase